MDVRAQLSSVCHLDKCIGCHACSVACKNLWTPRPGTECMWWNNVETNRGTGYPTLWEDQDKYRDWRFCVSGCPCKKVYHNWKTGKSEKCLLCFPRLETGQAPTCFHTCVGRIRYTGVLLYDADKVEEVAWAAEEDLVTAQRGIILDPRDATALEAARRNGISDEWLTAAPESPVCRFVREWELALHPKHRILPMLF